MLALPFRYPHALPGIRIEKKDILQFDCQKHLKNLLLESDIPSQARLFPENELY